MKKKICRQKMSIMFNEICINEEMMPIYIYYSTVTSWFMNLKIKIDIYVCVCINIYIYIYIYVCVGVYKCIYIYIYIYIYISQYQLVHEILLALQILDDLERSGKPKTVDSEAVL